MINMQTLNECLDELRRLNVDLRRQLEIVEAVVPQANSLISRLAPLGLASQSAVLGEVVFDRAFDPQGGQTDSSQLFQAAVVIPDGFGVVLWDLEEFIAFRNKPFDASSLVRLNFVPYDNCSLAAKALLWPQVVPLLNRVCNIVRPV